MQILNDEECKAVIVALARTRSFSTEEAKIAIEWAQEAAMHAAILNLVLKDQMNLDVKDGEVVFTLNGEA